jgi:hypothetical protein
VQLALAEIEDRPQRGFGIADHLVGLLTGCEAVRELQAGADLLFADIGAVPESIDARERGSEHPGGHDERDEGHEVVTLVDAERVSGRDEEVIERGERRDDADDDRGRADEGEGHAEHDQGEGRNRLVRVDQVEERGHRNH